MSKPIARVGDKVICPRKGHRGTVIVTGSSHTLGGRAIATVGSKTSCGATIVTGSSQSTVDGKPVAVIGSKTSHGGTVVKGSSRGTTK